MADRDDPRLWRAERDRLAAVLDDIAKDRAGQSYAHSEVADIMSEIARLDRLIAAGGNPDQATTDASRV